MASSLAVCHFQIGHCRPTFPLTRVADLLRRQVSNLEAGRAIPGLSDTELTNRIRLVTEVYPLGHIRVTNEQSK